MKKWLPFLTFSLLLFSCKEKNTPNNETNSNTLTQKVEQYINAHAANNKFSGSVLIAKGDSILYQNSWGYANRDFSIKNTDSTKFLIGSITKPFTAYAILLLEKQGKLNLNDKLSKYFPSFPNAKGVTIIQLLRHTSGIKDYRNLADWKADSKSDATTPLHTINKIAQLPQVYNFEPDSNFRYSNVGYILLGLIIEQTSGKTFAQYISNEILTPLNLTQTGIANNHSIINNLAQGYFTTPLEITKAEYINYMQPFASGNMYSTPTDLLKFTKAVFNSKLLSAEKTKEIFTNNTGKYGYGWGIRNYNGTKAYGHYGGMNGFIGAITYIPTGDYFICFLTNDDNTPKQKISADLVAIIQGEEVEPPKKINATTINDSVANKVIGNYLIKQGDTLTVYNNKEGLFMQETGQQPQQLFSIGEHKYALTLLEFEVHFTNFENGKAQHLNLMLGKTLTAKRIK